MKIYNYTPHAVTVFDEDGKQTTFAPIGLARASQTAVIVGEINGIPVKKMTFGAVEGLPESAADDEYFIVSAITAQAAVATSHPLKDRLITVADALRDESGRIVGCKSFAVMLEPNF